MKRISLNGIWNLKGKEQGLDCKTIELSATVPGVVQLDLANAGFLPKDLLVGMNIKETEKFESYEWWYEKKFVAPEEKDNVFLVFRGVDCLAEYFLNGEKIGESKNMFIAHEFNVSGKLLDGENTLTVHISSPIEYAFNQEYDLYNIAISGRVTPINTAIRRAPHSYGWDIMPRAVTSGLWRDVYLEVRDRFYFTQTFFDVGDGRETFCYSIDGNYREFKDVEIEVYAKCKDSEFTVRNPAKYKAGRIYLKIKNPYYWWPIGYGEQNLYDVKLKIFYKGEVVHEKEMQFAYRSVKLEYTEQTDGVHGYFRIKINGEEILCKGSNWVPLDPFHSRDKERYGRALSLAKECGCNILRCWGGNVYEDHEFFEFCDKNGIMVWQDFAMACNNYPQREEFFEELRREATYIVKEYRHHPSLVLWCGDNEVDRYAQFFNGTPSLNKISREVLKDVVFLHDVGRPYLVSSPYISDAVAKDKSIYPAEDHLWGLRKYHKSDFYKHHKSHFVSEIGCFGLPDIESVNTFVTADKKWPYQDNPEWALHSTDQNNDTSRVRDTLYQLRQQFGKEPERLEDIILASQFTQAEAYKFFIEMTRIKRPIRSGIIWWNLLDGWPQTSDAVVDYYFRKKRAYKYIKRVQQPFIIAIDEIWEGIYRIFACNDTLKEVSGNFTIKDAESEEIIYSGEFDVKENCAKEIAAIKTIEFIDKKMLIIEWTANGEKGFNHYLTGFAPYSFEWYKGIANKYNL